MTHTTIIDSLFSLPQRGPVVHIDDCVPFREDLTPGMKASGIAGAVLAHGNCRECPYEWECAERMTHEVAELVRQHPKQLRGLAAYDPLRIGQSLGWIDELVRQGTLAGVYIHSEACLSGLNAARMYPLYGVCAMLGAPVVVEFFESDRWAYQRAQLELVAADFPDLELLVAPPARGEPSAMVPMMRRFPRISFLLGPRELQGNDKLCEYLELQGRSRAMFRSAGEPWPAVSALALAVPLSPAARRAYLAENAQRVFGFPAGEAASLSA